MSSVVPSARGVSPAVLAAGFAVAVGAFPTLLGFNESSVPTGALYGAGWPAFGVAAALLLDRGRETRLGVVLAVLALAPAVVMAVALPKVTCRSGDGSNGSGKARDWCWSWRRRWQ